MIALIDADILVYRVGFTTQDVDETLACWRMNDTIQNSILKPLNAEQYQCFLTSQDQSNFRFDIFPAYKANRKDFKKPIHYNALREYLIREHQAIVVEGEEADDRLGIVASQVPNTVICSIDKDLKQIPGRHFNFVKQELTEVTPLEGLRFFYKQVLMGDVADNIHTIYGIGTKTADKILQGCASEAEMFSVTIREYQKAYPLDYEHRMFLAGQLLKIRTKEGELWQFPVGSMLSSTITALPLQNGMPSIPSNEVSAESVDNHHNPQDSTLTINTSPKNDN
ncbi:MAG: hypothetical protein ACYC9R_06215 [Nitrosotalea sp.]